MYSVPASTIPVPIGAEPARPEPLPGTSALLLSWIQLLMQIVQPTGPGTAGLAPAGQRPIGGDGRSSLFCEFETRPVLLWSNSPFWMIRFPPEFVPEYASAEYCARSWSRTELQFGHAPT